MDLHIEQLLSEFNEKREGLEELKNVILEYLNDLICVKNKLFIVGIEGRVKSYGSLKGKLELKGYKYKKLSDITDLVGTRVITYYTDQVDLIGSLIEKLFIIDVENSIDKRRINEVDKFGYMSLHYICQIPKSLYFDPKYPEINEIKFEIQLRTCLQHVWATIFHDTGYKSDIEVPKEYIRRLARLEGLLEIADDEFLTIRNEINNYRTKIRSLVSDGQFSEISFSIDSYKDYLGLDPYRKLIDKIASINNAEVEEVSYLKFYLLFVDMKIKNLQELEQMRIDNSDEAYKLALLQFSGTDIDIIASTVAIQNVVIIYLVKQDLSKKEIMQLLTHLYGERGSSEAFVDRIISQAKSVINI